MLTSLRTFVFNVILTALYFLLVPACIILACPIYLYRFLVSKVIKYWNPTLSHLVSSRSIVLGIDGYPSNPKWNLVVWITMEEILDLVEFQKYFENTFVNAQDSTGQLLYPEYQQSIIKRMGFYFWKWNKKFRIDQHIDLYRGVHSDSVIDDSKLIQIIKELTAASWSPDQSPWEFKQIRNYTGKENPGAQSILIFRLHHVLGDGYFILKLLMEDICKIPLKMAAQPKQLVSQKSLISRIVAGPSNFMKLGLIGTRRDDNPWHLPESKIAGHSNAALSRRIPLEFIKQIRNFYGVSFTAVIKASVTGGLRTLMARQGIPPPPEIHQTITVQMPGHPQKLCNHFIFSFIALPTGIPDPLERLKVIEANLQYLKSSFLPLLTFWMVPFVGSLFPWMMTPFTTNHLTTCLLSNFPGTPAVPIFRGVKVVDMMFGAGLGPGSTGIGFTLISYVDSIRLFTVVDSAILPSDEAVEELNEKILDELEVLATFIQKLNSESTNE